MTRVEKYRQYREEISNMKFETITQKSEVSKKIVRVKGKAGGRKLNYEQIMIIQDEFNDGEVNFRRKKYIGLTKYEIFYYLFAIIFVVGIVLAIVLLGLKN